MLGSTASCLAQAGVVELLGDVLVEFDNQQRIASLMLPKLDVRGSSVPAGCMPLDLRIADALQDYVHGDDRALRSLPIAPGATSFVDCVRREMAKIPYGGVATYGDIAKNVGKPGAARAVGRVCATNALLLLVPCHRVVASNGLGGFALGLEAKQTLLAMEHEAAQTRASRISGEVM